MRGHTEALDAVWLSDTRIVTCDLTPKLRIFDRNGRRQMVTQLSKTVPKIVAVDSATEQLIVAVGRDVVVWKMYQPTAWRICNVSDKAIYVARLKGQVLCVLDDQGKRREYPLFGEVAGQRSADVLETPVILSGTGRTFFERLLRR